MATLLLTIILVGSNMDIILKQGVTFQVRSEITEDPSISQSFSDKISFTSDEPASLVRNVACPKSKIKILYIVKPTR